MILLLISIFLKSDKISIIEMSYRYIKHTYPQLTVATIIYFQDVDNLRRIENLFVVKTLFIKFFCVFCHLVLVSKDFFKNDMYCTYYLEI